MGSDLGVSDYKCDQEQERSNNMAPFIRLPTFSDAPGVSVGPQRRSAGHPPAEAQSSPPEIITQSRGNQSQKSWQDGGSDPSSI